MAGQQTDPLFQQLDDWLASVAAQLSPGHRRKLTRDVAIGLRKRQQKRIASQKNPSGESYQARRRKILRTQGGIKFIWNDEARELRNWRTTQMIKKFGLAFVQKTDLKITSKLLQ